MAAANLRGNPENLFRANWDDKICNLRFFTYRTPVWRNTFYKYYEGRVTEQDIQHALQLCIRDSEDPKKKHLTVNLYHNGTVMLQGARPVLTIIENQIFDSLRGMVEAAQQI